MSWSALIDRLKAGETISFRPVGNSMTPRIRSRQLCTFAPANVDDLEKGDVAFCKVCGRIFTHLVLAKKDGQVQIGNNHGHVNGWTSAVFGKLVKVED